MISIVNKLKNDRTRSITFMIIAAVMWSTGGLLIKSIKLNAIAIAGVRSLIAALLMLAVIKKPNMKFGRYKVGCAAAYAGTVILFVIANKLTAAATVILLQYTAPIYVALLSAWFLNERITKLDWAAIFIVLGGMVLFFIDKMSSGNLLGSIYAILSGICFAFLALLLRKQKDESPLESVFWGNVLTAIIGVPFMFGSAIDTSSMIGLLFLGTVQLGIPYILYISAIKHVSALEAVLLPVIEPLLNPVWVFLVLGEFPGPWAFVGGLIVLSAIVGRSVIITLKANKRREDSETAYKEESRQ